MDFKNCFANENLNTFGALKSVESQYMYYNVICILYFLYAGLINVEEKLN